MITAIDTNVLSALWLGEDGSSEAETLLEKAKASGSLVICGVVYAECLAGPMLTEPDVDRFLRMGEITVEFGLGEDLWRDAGRRFSSYAKRRRRSSGGETRRLIADFLIGSHALLNADRLITFDAGHYRRNFPELTLMS